MIALLLGCAAEPVAPPALPNVLLVSMDSVRADRLSAYGYARDTSPSLARLAANGVRYTHAHTTANDAVYAHASLLSGRHPGEVAALDPTTFVVPPDVVTLAEALAGRGYDTAAFTGGGPLSADFGFDQGFDVLRAPPPGRLGSLHDSVPGALGWLEHHRTEKPWFMFLHGFDAHPPYTRPGPFRHPFDPGGATPRIESILSAPMAVERIVGQAWYTDGAPSLARHASGQKVFDAAFYDAPPVGDPEILTDAELAHLGSHYDAGLVWGDLYLGVMLAGLQQRGELDRTVIIVTSDHGEDLLDHGRTSHRTGLWDSTTNVPLVVTGPGFRAGKVSDALVDLRQVFSTILWAAGVPRPDGVTAKALQDDGKPDAVYAVGVRGERSVRTDQWRLVERGADAVLYRDEVVTQDAAKAAELHAMLEAWQAGLRSP